MTVLEVLTAPNPVLNQKCDPVEHFDESLKTLVADMFETMQAHEGIGLAAPQVGILQRLFICQLKTRQLVIINPVITLGSLDCESDEGCLSIPNTTVRVDRSNTVKVEAQDVNGNSFTLNESGMMAIVIQHEFDHLEGRLITDFGHII